MKRYLEVGVFTGYSSTVVALAMPPEGRIVGVRHQRESPPSPASSGRRRAWPTGIELRLGPAVETLDAMIADGQSGSFDFAFIDADKPNYLAYYERVLALIRTGGVIAIDNVLWDGKVADKAVLDEQTVAIRQVNEHLHNDERIDLALAPIGDGVTLARNASVRIGGFGGLKDWGKHIPPNSPVLNPG